MKNTTTTTLLASLALTGISFAGPSGYSGKAPFNKGVVPPPAAPSCNCFEPGGQFSLYAAAITGAKDVGDAPGAGFAVDYFFTRYVGAEFDATWAFVDSTIHSFNASIVLRAPITSACIAPYALAGGGFHTNGVNEGTLHAGLGLDIRLANCFGIFADARYTWNKETDDYTLLRAGIRLNF